MTNDHNDISLDPNDWDKFRKIGYQMIDLLVEYHKNVRDRKVWQPLPLDIKNSFNQSLPENPSSLEEVIENFKKTILPYPTGNIHPRFWGWVHGTGTSSGAIAELLAAMMNPNTGGREHVANYVERQVIQWAIEMLHYQQGASGLLTSGCSMANLTGLAVARQAKLGKNIRKTGLFSISKPPTFYGSTQLHSSIQKALEVLGLGSDSLRFIATNSNFEIDIDQLRATILKDIENGYQPVAIIGNAGTVNSGAIDDFTTLATIAKEFDLWFHIDGAFGSLARLLPEYMEKMKGYELADSVAFDMHKWMYLPYEIGCILVKDESLHRSTFSLRPDYLAQQTRGLASFDKWPTEYGVELSRGFRALKAWMAIKEHGISTYRDVIQKNILQARYFETLISYTPKLELMAPVSLNIVCFRYFNPKMDENQIEQLNTELLLRVQESGIAVFSSTQLNGKYTLRVANTNQRSKFEDFDLLVETLIEFGDKILMEFSQITP